MIGLLILPCILSLLLLQCSAVEFNDQVMGRVSERLADFMGVPVDATQRTRNFRHIGGFANAMGAMDRNPAMKHLYSEVNVKVYYGLEDGTFVIYSDSDSNPYVSYRPPGESGFDGVDVPVPMQKHFSLCVNRDTGETEDCIMSEGSSYVDCAGLDCSGATLELCPDQASQTDCSSLPEENRTECESSITWCSVYDIRQVQPGEIRGFVPRVYSCINSNGLPEQEPGRVLLNAITQETGSCYFRDGESEVNRSIEGEYAFCGVADTVCNDAFLGVYRSRDYDPRYREWYKLAKEVQTVVWSDPYPFFSSLAIGITLNRPIHSVENGRTVFKGVLAVDYSMDQIATFLAEQYAGSEINVLIVEAEEPYYVVASSTGTPGATLVLKEDETQPCSVNENQDQLCNVVRVKIDNFGGNQADKVLVAAFHAQSAAGWPRNELVSVKVTDEPGAEAHASQSELFEQDNANLKWRLIVTMPIDTAANDAALRGDNVFAIICLLGGLGFLICFLLFIIFFSKRHDKAVVHADWRFTSAFILGCAGMNLSTFTMLGENRDQLCMLRMWSFNLLFACAISPLFVKVYRMYKLFKASVGFRRVEVNHFQAFLMTLPIAVSELILLSIFSIVDPPRQIEELRIEGSLTSQHLFCDQETRAFFICQVIFDGVLVLIGCVLAYLTRDLDPRFGEAKQLAFAMYNIAFTGIIIVVILQVVDMDQSGKLILQAIGVLWGSLFSAFAFVLPRLIEVVQAKKTKRESWMAEESGDIMKIAVVPHSSSSSKMSWLRGSKGNTSLPCQVASSAQTRRKPERAQEMASVSEEQNESAPDVDSSDDDKQRINEMASR